MKTKRRIVVMTVLAASFVGGAILLTGCQMPGRVLASSRSETCPTCRTETRTTSIKGLTYKKHVCPSCKRVVIPDSDYGDPSELEYAHVCDHCEARVIECEQCKNR